MNTNKKQTWLANGLILLGIAGRLLPHLPNVTPVGAVSLVGGAKLSRLWRWMIPFIALVFTDALLGFSFSTPFVYAAFAISILLGQFVQGDKRYFKLGTFCVIGSLQFFIITNFGVWMEGLLYPKTVAGLMQCYAMALPFLRNTLMGDLAWSFGLFILIEKAQALVRERTMDSGPWTMDQKIS